jgi:hypothetical protein
MEKQFYAVAEVVAAVFPVVFETGIIFKFL